MRWSRGSDAHVARAVADDQPINLELECSNLIMQAAYRTDTIPPTDHGENTPPTTLDRDTLHYKDVAAQRYADLVYNGQWVTTLRKALDAFFDVTQARVSGQVRLKLYKGNVIPVGRKSPYSLYREDFATFGQDSVYDQSDAEGFITLFGLPLKVQAMRELETTRPKGAVPEHLETPDYSIFKRD